MTTAARGLIAVCGLLAVSGLSVAVAGVATAQPPAKDAAPGAQPAAKPDAGAPAPSSPSAAAGAWQPGVPLGTKIPSDVSTININGGESMLSVMWKTRPSVVVFYRGNWCPYCVQHLRLWNENLEALRQSGGSVIVVSYEKISQMMETQKKFTLAMPLVTDHQGQAAKAFNVGFTLDAETQANYKKAGLDLAARSSRDNWDLHVPATFIVDTDGSVLWSKVEKDYTQRASPKEVIEWFQARKKAWEEAQKAKGAKPAAPAGGVIDPKKKPQ